MRRVGTTAGRRVLSTRRVAVAHRRRRRQAILPRHANLGIVAGVEGARGSASVCAGVWDAGGGIGRIVGFAGVGIGVVR